MAVNKGCHDVGMKKQNLGNTTAGIVGVSYCCMVLGIALLMLAVLTDGRWKLAATYCNTNRCHHCGVMLQDVLHLAE